MWKAIKKLVREYRELSDENRQVFLDNSLSYLCHFYTSWTDKWREESEKNDNELRLREVTEKEFVPFTYWDVLFELPGKQTYAIEVIDYEFVSGNRFVSARDEYGVLIVAEDAIVLRATEVIVDCVGRLPDWCPLFKCEFGIYRTSPSRVKENANADD